MGFKYGKINLREKENEKTFGNPEMKVVPMYITPCNFMQMVNFFHSGSGVRAQRSVL